MRPMNRFRSAVVCLRCTSTRYCVWASSELLITSSSRSLKLGFSEGARTELVPSGGRITR